MKSSGDFNVSVAGALVLGGIAASLLASVVALGGYGRPSSRAMSVGPSGAVPSTRGAGGALPDAEVEYLLDTTEPASTATPRSP